MATLQLEFNCLCLFVRDEANDVVHVLMPRTDHPGMDRHVVRVYHPELPPPPDGKSMEGLEWVLGPAKGSANLLSLATNDTGELVDVTVASGDANAQNGKKVDKDLVTTVHDKVLTRVVLRAGTLVDRRSPVRWKLKGRRFKMVDRVVWEIDDVDDSLTWNKLKNSDPFPLTSLAELGPPQPLPGPGHKTGYQLRIFHTTEEGLPPDGDVGVLDELAIQQHFRHFYDLLNYNPSPDQLPRDPEVPFLRTFNCGVGQALLGE
jgi:hypothetical protein